MVGERALSLPWELKRAGLCGRLVGQNCLSSRLSSWPVVVQLVMMLSRRSWTWRFKSISFFLSQLTLSSCREVPRLNCRVMYFS
ncbi:MAG: hypothetical protein B7X76_05230 [Azorhizobium sp. 39-67-5]|nr:MAG: hypothetical protein B7X76_05230 [Azorhizobium sp. 39-67-5]